MLSADANDHLEQPGGLKPTPPAEATPPILDPTTATMDSFHASALRDLDSLIEAHKLGLDPVNVTLPSGRFLHNPAKRRVKDAGRWAQQQIANATASSADWLDGVRNPARDPIQAAIDAKQKYLNNFAEAVKQDKWAKNLRKSSHSEIVAVAQAVGESGYTTGITARSAKIARVIGELQPLAQSVSDAIQAMPDATIADREKRLLEAKRLMFAIGSRR